MEDEGKYEVYNTPKEYLDTLLQEENKEKLLTKVFGHNIVDLVYLKRVLKELDDLADLADVDLYLDSLISEKKVLIKELTKELTKLKEER